MVEKVKMYVLYVGLNDRNTKKPVMDYDDAIPMLEKLFDSVTFIPAIGFYTHDDGQRVKEKTLKIEYLDFAGDFSAEKTVSIIKSALNQESIAVRIADVYSVLM